MKNLTYLNQYRQKYLGFYGDIYNGKFMIPKGNIIYQIIASNHFCWDHVSVSVLYKSKGQECLRMPTWEELEEITSLFFEGYEPVMEIHPSKKEYVNTNPYVLHLWRSNVEKLPMLPMISEIKDYDVVELPEKNHFLRILYGERDGWDCYEVQVLKGRKILKRFPSWDEMCIAKKHLLGEDRVAFEFHNIETVNRYSTRLWIPPKETQIELPPSIMVGFKDNEIPEPLKVLLKSLFK